MNKTLLDQLIHSAWKVYQNVKTMSCVVKNSIPILWFGDLKAYDESEKKIVTIGLNPSLNEFDDGTTKGTAVRFPKAAPLVGKNTLTHADVNLYTDAMNEYFTNEPYVIWFNHYERVINLLDASYFGNTSNTAMHIDIYSPIATDPTWGRLCENARNKLQVAYPTSDFQNLLNGLNPDIILISANKNIVEKEFGNSGWTIYPNASASTRYVKIKKDNNGRIIIWGYNFHGVPFGGIGKSKLQNIFVQIKTQFKI